MQTHPIIIDRQPRNETKTELMLTAREKETLTKVLIAVLEGFADRGNIDCEEYYRIHALYERVENQSVTQYQNSLN